MKTLTMEFRHVKDELPHLQKHVLVFSPKLKACYAAKLCNWWEPGELNWETLHHSEGIFDFKLYPWWCPL